VIGIYAEDQIRLDGLLEELIDGVNVVRIPRCPLRFRRLSRVVDRLRLRLILQHYHKTEHFDIVEMPDYRGYGAYCSLNIPMVVRLHSLPKNWSMHKGISWFEKRTLAKARHIVAVSDWAAEIGRLHGRLTGNYSRIYYSISDEFMVPQSLDRENDLVMFAGTLVDRKGIWTLAKAWPLVKIRCPSSRLVIIGKDQREHPAKPSNRERLRNLLDNHDVTFIDHLEQRELVKWYQRAAVACFPSKRETFGLVAAEAMLCGAPVIYTREGPGPEVGGYGERAILVDPENHEELAEAIVAILENSTPYREKAQKARQWVIENMSNETVLSQSIQLYEHLCETTAHL
jgi:glycosyltransferase involved in cell wall biosynthesis